MKIILTGGAGFIGSHIADAYIEDGHDVVIIDDLSAGKRENINPKAAFHKLDIRSEEAAALVKSEKPDILNHHAAQIDVRVSVDKPVADINVNVVSFVSLLEAGVKSGVKKVIFASSGGAVYGDDVALPTTEDCSTNPTSPYGINKLMCEKYLHYYACQYGLRYMALRYPNVYGPRQSPKGDAGVVAVFLSKMLAHGQPVINGDGKQTRDYVFIDDVVNANRIALRNEACGYYNVGTGVETDVNAIFDALCGLLGANCKKTYGPEKSGEQRRSAISFAKIEKNLGWKPTIKFSDGMRLTTEWFKNLTAR